MKPIKKVIPIRQATSPARPASTPKKLADMNMGGSRSAANSNVDTKTQRAAAVTSQGPRTTLTDAQSVTIERAGTQGFVVKGNRGAFGSYKEDTEVAVTADERDSLVRSYFGEVK